MIRVATYNVHGFIGRDGRRDLARVAQVITGLECVAVGLQEVDSRGATTTVRELEDRTGMQAVAGPTIIEPDGDYGNVLLTKSRGLDSEEHDLTVPGREPRGAILARLRAAEGVVFTMIVTHLGLRRQERRRQVEMLLDICGSTRIRGPLVLAGDFNEWNPRAPSLRLLRGELGPSRAVRTFPVWRPILALDRIWVRPAHAVRRVRAVRTAATRVASDHLPVVAELDQWPT
ncbi:MAG: endonuclease/exonuclease/phosphatase family protein [Acidobacteriota bacterium]|jgi:endonuclease/exonuclease/phosphatase family metal-dependent hydrolase